MKTAINKIALTIDHTLDLFSKKYESLLGFVRIEMQGRVMVAHSITDSKGKVIEASFPPVRSSLKGGCTGFDELSLNVIASFGVTVEKLSKGGADRAYLDRVYWLVKEASYYLKNVSCLRDVIEQITESLKEDFKEGMINNHAPEEGTKQYMEGTALDQFLLGLEKLLGFGRARSKNSKGSMIYDLEQISTENDAVPVVRPALFYHGNEKPFLAKNQKSRWGNIPVANRDYYRVIAISNFKKAVEEIFKSGELDRYYVNVIDLVSKRLRLLQDEESPLALTEAVITFYQSWFLRVGGKAKTSGKTLDRADLQRAGQQEMFNPDYLMHDDESGLDHANGLDALQSNTIQDEVDEEEAVTPEEEEAALIRLMDDDGFDYGDI